MVNLVTGTLSGLTVWLIAGRAVEVEFDGMAIDLTVVLTLIGAIVG